MTNTLQKISPKNRVEILAVSLDGNVLRTLTSYLEIDVQQNVHDKTVRTIVEKYVSIYIFLLLFVFSYHF